MMNKPARHVESKPIELVIVIINYFSAQLTANLVKQINLHGIPENIKTSIVCIDNSTNQVQTSILNKIKTNSICSFDLIISSKNLGFGNAVNTALNNRYFDFACTINPDVSLFKDSLKELLLHASNHYEQGIWGGLTVNAQMQADGRHAWQEPSLMNTLGWAISLKYLMRNPRWQDNYKHKLFITKDTYSVDCVSGCCLLISATAWQATNGFDSDFFLYSEEVDLCRRARELGYQPTIVPQAKLVHSPHKKSESINRIDFIYSAKLRYMKKHNSLFFNIIYRLIVTIGALIRAAKALLLGHISSSIVWAKLSLKVLFDITNKT